MCAVQPTCCGPRMCRRRTAGVAWRQAGAGCAPTSTAAAARCGSPPCTPACRAKPSPRRLSGLTALQASYSLVSTLLLVFAPFCLQSLQVSMCVCHHACCLCGYVSDCDPQTEYSVHRKLGCSYTLSAAFPLMCYCQLTRRLLCPLCGSAGC